MEVIRLTLSLRKKCPYSELFWSAYFPNFSAFGLNRKYFSNIMKIVSLFLSNDTGGKI